MIRNPQPTPGQKDQDPPWEAAARAKRQATLTKLTEAQRLWPLPSDEVSTDEIADRVGLSVKALYNHLGPRGLAQTAAGLFDASAGGSRGG